MIRQNKPDRVTNRWGLLTGCFSYYKIEALKMHFETSNSACYIGKPTYFIPLSLCSQCDYVKIETVFKCYIINFINNNHKYYYETYYGNKILVHVLYVCIVDNILRYYVQQNTKINYFYTVLHKIASTFLWLILFILLLSFLHTIPLYIPILHENILYFKIKLILNI